MLSGFRVQKRLNSWGKISHGGQLSHLPTRAVMNRTRRPATARCCWGSGDSRGIWVWDQWAGQPVQRRYIRFENGVGRPGNDGDAYSVISQ